MCTIQPSVIIAAIMRDVRNVYDTAQCDKCGHYARYARCVRYSSSVINAAIMRNMRNVYDAVQCD